ncbi:MAG: hypothetical protein OXC40_00195, partial [Proteobacteria bacterium]|nr:hypothetical protein [Pseudomonadota bacterium]
MIPFEHIKKNPEYFQNGASKKKVNFDFPSLFQLASELSEAQKKQQDMRAQRNKLSQEVGLLARRTEESESSDILKAKRSELIGQVAQLKKELAVYDITVRDKKAAFKDLLLRVPQPPRDDVPIGFSDQDNVEVKQVGDVSPKDKQLSHKELGESLQIINFEHAVKLSGSRSYVLTGKGALLEQAILRLAYDFCIQQNYRAMSVPVLVTEECMEGTGYFPVGKEQSYHCPQDKLSLVGTGEVPVCAFYMNETLNEK